MLNKALNETAISSLWHIPMPSETFKIFVLILNFEEILLIYGF